MFVCLCVRNETAAQNDFKVCTMVYCTAQVFASMPSIGLGMVRKQLNSDNRSKMANFDRLLL